MAEKALSLIKCVLNNYIELNSREGMNLLRDKGLTYERLKEFYKRECLSISSIDDNQKHLEFVEKHGLFFYKPLASDSATNCCKKILLIAVLRN